MREKMRRMRHINWSEILRSAIRETIRKEEMSGRHLDPESLARADALADSIRKPTEGWDSAREIRKWRDLRK